MEPDNELLSREEWNFHHDVLIELFSFDELEIQMNRLAKVIRENDNIFEKETVDKIAEKRLSFRSEIVDVSMRFIRQIESILACRSDDNIKFLQERIKKASVYYFDKLNEMESLSEMVNETDNKAVNATVKAIIDLIREILYVKTAC